MQIKIIQCKWKKYRMQMKNYQMQMNKIEYCNVSHAIDCHILLSVVLPGLQSWYQLNILALW